MVFENYPEHQKRSDDIELKLPWGASIRASGTLVVLLLVVLAGFALVIIDLRAHENSNVARQSDTNKFIQELTCVLTLSQEERVEVRRGENLSRWCVFLKERERAVSK
jgi:hypothetical protein